MIKIKPLSNYIFVEILDEKEITKSGIIVPTSTEKKSTTGKVAAINEKILSSGIRVGDKILFSEYSPNKVKVNDKEYLVIKEEDVMAIIK